MNKAVIGLVSNRNGRHDLGGDLPLHCLLRGPNPTVEAVEYLLSKFPDAINTTTTAGDSPFWLACVASASEDVKYVLLRKNPDIIREMDETAENGGPGN